jgi:hypothetical protein
MVTDKIILDACCGSRMFWNDKKNPLVLFQDKRQESHTLCDNRTLTIAPDVVADFTNMPYADGVFKLVVFDPPHLVRCGKNAWIGKKYGILGKDWKTELKMGFDECMRVLEPHGILIFKWNEDQIKVSEILAVFGENPLFGHPSGKASKTHWMCFMKM